VADGFRGPDVLARLLAELPVDQLELQALPEPWGTLSRAVLHAEAPRRGAALGAVLAGRQDRAVVVAALRVASRRIAATRPASHVDRDVLVHLDHVDVSPVRWLWPGRLPLGKLVVLDGDPGLGKSALTLDLAARVSAHRPMPDGAAADLDGPAGVVRLSAEDGLADTIRPRLEAAGADLARVAALTLVADAPSTRRGRRPASPAASRLPTLADFDAIRRAIIRVGAALVVVDPIMAYLPRGVDSGKDADVRALLTQLAALADAEQVTILAVRHLNKSGAGNPLYRGGGSIGIIGAARSGLLVAPDVDDPSNARRVLASTKANLARAPVSLAYHLEAADNGALRVAWDGPTEHTASGLLDAARQREHDRPTAVGDACAVLQQILADGPLPAAPVLQETRASGVSLRTLRRAAALLGIRPRKDGHSGWTWSLPIAQRIHSRCRDGWQVRSRVGTP
jgi:hypothetical protein